MSNTLKRSEILNSFSEGPKNDFERMALFQNDYMIESAKKMMSELERFIQTGEYSDYLGVSSCFYNVTKYMNARDCLITHNPDRRGEY